MKKTILALSAILACSHMANAQVVPPCGNEAKPYTRWWWLGSAVDNENIQFNLQQLHNAGIGGVEITPIYGVKGNDANNIPYLSPRWMNMLSSVETCASDFSMETDMATGTGWPFGGPSVPIEEAAATAIFETFRITPGMKTVFDISVKDAKQKDIATLQKVVAYRTDGKKKTTKKDNPFFEIRDLTQKFSDGGNTLETKWLPKGNWIVVALHCGRTRQKVKRAAPGGEGYVIDHFSRKSVTNYLNVFDKAFESSATNIPGAFFNDSYEVYGADWTPTMLDDFYRLRGYRLEDYLPVFVEESLDEIDPTGEMHKRIVSDYRETLGDLLLTNFTAQWTDWANSHGAITRNQAHGSPANLIDIYAAVDIPECEGFGLSDFGIKGLRTDTPYTRKNFSDLSMLKYASSAAHISGKKYTSSETFTWLTEHFRTSLSQCKPDIDLMFASGVNHVFFHGTCYSPKDAPWPGWRFYASVDMSHNNSYWDDMPAFSRYIERCQAFLQWGSPDNGILVYLPFYDMIYSQPGRLVQFDIHSMENRAPQFIASINSIVKAGYDCDYVSDKFLENAFVVYNASSAALATCNNELSSKYQAIVVPNVKFMPIATLRNILNFARQGVNVTFIGAYPKGEPGLMGRKNADEYAKLVGSLKKAGAKCVESADEIDVDDSCREPMRIMGLTSIRRKNPTGYHYFISNLRHQDFSEWASLAVDAKGAVVYDPMTGEWGRTDIVRDHEGKAAVYLDLKSGQSVIVRTFDNDSDLNAALAASGRADARFHNLKPLVKEQIDISQGWELSFVKSQPEIADTFRIGELKPWTALGDSRCNITMATGAYECEVNVEKADEYDEWILDLGDVRESARVIVNGESVDTLFAVPFQTRVGKYLNNGVNKIRLEVTNLPANRIAHLDRTGVVWRNFEEINVVDINYKRTLYSDWDTVPSGLNSTVRLIPAKYADAKL